jgi:hypothetical protein
VLKLQKQTGTNCWSGSLLKHTPSLADLLLAIVRCLPARATADGSPAADGWPHHRVQPALIPASHRIPSHYDGAVHGYSGTGFTMSGCSTHEQHSALLRPHSSSDSLTVPLIISSCKARMDICVLPASSTSYQALHTTNQRNAQQQERNKVRWRPRKPFPYGRAVMSGLSVPLAMTVQAQQSGCSLAEGGLVVQPAVLLSPFHVYDSRRPERLMQDHAWCDVDVATMWML